MTPGQAKKDAAARLYNVGATFASISAKTISFEDLARGSAVFVTVKGISPKDGDWTPVHAIQDERGKGYILRFQ